MISTLSAQQEIQRQHTALLAPTPAATDSSISKSSTAKTMPDTSPKHPAETDEDFPHSSPKRRKTAHGALETAKTDVWEFYADSEVDSDYGTPKRTKKAAKAKDSSTKGKSKKQRAKTAPTLVFDDKLGGPIAPPVVLDDEDDDDFVPEGNTKKRGRKKSEKPPQKDKRPTRGKTVAKETETVEIISSGDEALDAQDRALERTVSPAPAPASSFHVAVNGAPLATQEREQYQVFPPTATTQDEHTQEHAGSCNLPPIATENLNGFRPEYSFLPTSQAMASTVPDSDLYKNTPVIPPTDTSSGHANEPEPLDAPAQAAPQESLGSDPTPPIPHKESKEQPAEQKEDVAEPEPVETVDLIREIAKEEFGLRRKPSNVGSSEIRSGPPAEYLEVEPEMPPPPRKAAKIKLSKRKKVKLQKRPQTIAAFDFDFDDEEDEDEPVSKPKPRKKKGFLALNDEEDEDWGGETPTKGRKKAAEKKPVEKKPRGRPRKKPAPLIEDEEEEHPVTTSNAPTSEPAKTGSSSQTHPTEVVDSDGDSDLSPLSELDSNFGDDDKLDDLLQKKTASKSALSEVVNDASASRNVPDKAEDEDPVIKKGGRKGKKPSPKKTKAADSTPSITHTSDPVEIEPTPETPAPKSKSKAKPKRKVTIKKTAEIIDSENEEDEPVPKSDPPSPAKPSESNPPPVTPAKPAQTAPVPATPADQIGPKNEPLSSIIKREANRGSATPGSEGKLSWQQARYRVGLSKRQRIEPLHGYLKKET